MGNVPRHHEAANDVPQPRVYHGDIRVGWVTEC